MEVVVASLWHQGCPTGAEVRPLRWSSELMVSSLSSADHVFDLCYH